MSTLPGDNVEHFMYFPHPSVAFECILSQAETTVHVETENCYPNLAPDALSFERYSFVN